MLHVLNMSLQVLRTVLKNEINEISVCEDVERENGGFYTLISITDEQMRRTLAKELGTNRMFCENRDFIGSFSCQNSLNVVFVYRQESLLRNSEMVLAADFAVRREIALQLLKACAEAGAEGALGMLLLKEQNIHITRTGKIYFNYFLDFKQYRPQERPESYYSEAAAAAFEILSAEYRRQDDMPIESYPKELQVLFKKIQAQTFTGYNQIISSIRDLPDHPEVRLTGFRAVIWKCKKAFYWMCSHSMAIFVTLLIAVTLLYASHQIYLRASYSKSREMNTSYAGMENIGEVYLGDTDV